MNTYSHSDILKPRLCFLAILVFISQLSFAQSPIGLDEAIDKAKISNRSILIANRSVAVQEAQYELTKAMFRPYFGVQLTDIATNNPLNVFGFKLLQESVEQADFNPALLNDPGVRNQFNLSLNAMMPLYNPASRVEQDVVKSQIKMKEAIALRTVQSIELEVIKSYYMLLLSQHAMQVLEDTYAAAQSNYDISNNYFDQGLLLKSDLLDMQVMVIQSEQALATARMNVANAQSHFNHVLNTETHTDFLPTDPITNTQEVESESRAMNPQRADIMAIQHGINSMELMSTAASKLTLPTVKAFGSLALNDEIPFENRANNFQVGVTLSWDIYKGHAVKSTINKIQSEIIVKQDELELKVATAELEILQTQRAIEDIRMQIKMHELSIEQAKEALKIRKNRFAQGLEKSTDIINSETQLSHRRLARLQSLFELNMKIAYLKYLLN